MANYETRISLNNMPEAVFDFLIRPENSLAASPPGMQVTILDAPEVMQLGSRVTLQIQIPGHAQRFVHEVIEFERPRRIVVRQVEGVFKRYVHEQIVEPQGEGVEVIDRVDFAPPGGLLGFLLTERRLREGMEHGFAHRHRLMKRRLERKPE